MKMNALMVNPAQPTPRYLAYYPTSGHIHDSLWTGDRQTPFYPSRMRVFLFRHRRTWLSGHAQVTRRMCRVRRLVICTFRPSVLTCGNPLARCLGAHNSGQATQAIFVKFVRTCITLAIIPAFSSNSQRNCVSRFDAGMILVCSQAFFIWPETQSFV